MLAITLSLVLSQPLIFTFTGCPNNNNILDVAPPIGATHFIAQIFVYLDNILGERADLRDNPSPISDVILVNQTPPLLRPSKRYLTGQPYSIIAAPNEPPPTTPPSGYPTGQPITK